MENNDFKTVDDIQYHLDKQQYIANRELSTSLFLSLKMNKPIFLEGEPGVGKTEIAKALAEIMDTKLIRLQCYEGLDVHNSIYEWNYSRQILQIRMMEVEGKSDQESNKMKRQDKFWSRSFSEEQSVKRLNEFFFRFNSNNK